MLNSHKLSRLGAAMLIATAAVTSLSAAEAPRPAAIAFASQGGINDWRADGAQGIWVQDLHRQWYYAKFMGTCIGLPFANTVGFATEPSGELNRWSAILVRDSGKCFFQTFEPSAAPGSVRDRDITHR